MHCFLHIGVEKTGTTSLQNHLYKNKDILRKKKFILTKSFGFPNNYKLSLISSNASTKNKSRYCLNFLKNPKLNKYRILRKAKGELKSANKQHKFIFSSEHLHSKLKSAEEIQNIKENLQSIGFKSFSIVVVLRPVIEMLRSRISTGFKNGNFENPIIFDPWKHKVPHVYQIKSTMKRWMDIFGKENLSVIQYSKESLLSDFFELIDSEIDISSFSPLVNKNKSLSFEIMQSVFLNKEILEKRLVNKKERQDLINDLINQFGGEANQNKIYISEELQSKFNKAFKMDNDFIYDNFGFSIDSVCKTEEVQRINNDLLPKISHYIEKTVL